MQIYLEVTPEIRSEAEMRGMPIVDYVEMLIQKGREALAEDENLNGAIERIRALRSPEVLFRR